MDILLSNVFVIILFYHSYSLLPDLALQLRVRRCCYFLWNRDRWLV